MKMPENTMWTIEISDNMYKLMHKMSNIIALRSD